MHSDPSTRRADHIVYLTGLYPAVSHTFILREVTALRALGLRVTTCSVNRPQPAQMIGPAEQAAARTTFYLLDHARGPSAFLAAAGWAMRRPVRVARVLGILRHSGARGIGRHLRQLAYLAEGIVLARFLDRCGAKRIHNQLGMASASVSLYASVLAGIPFSFTLHGPDDFFADPSRQMAVKIAHADVVACISAFCRDQARQLCDNRHWHKLHIVRCGIDPASYRHADRTPPLRHLLFVGRLVPVKGVSVLIRAFGGIARDVPQAVLTIVGDGPERAGLQRLVSHLGLQDRIRFTGARTQQQVAAHMAEADLFVLPSFAEGLPVVLMEAMASGLPVIATDIAGIPELVQDNATGRLVAAGDEAQLAQAIRDCLADPKPALEMAGRGQAHALASHDMWQQARVLADLFQAAGQG
ncbi:glycosyltransferase [uncultured Paracoccus sp.]|uniref:glycosyltransferase n=1 Tax=uncultured Paracoccus sp. TaxID=189685 RepID=UPI0025FAE841|nr:glycosyltransferase [uncultured Paracoccus sp.]